MQEIKFLKINMFSLSASLAGKMAMVLFAVGVKCFSIALEGMDLSILGQVIKKAIDSGYPYLRILFRNFLIQFPSIEKRIKGSHLFFDQLLLLGSSFHVLTLSFNLTIFLIDNENQ